MPDRYIQIKTTTYYFVFLLFVIFYYPTFLTLYQLWGHPVNKGYSHGLLLSALVVGLLYYGLSKEKNLQLDLIYLPIIFLSSILWLLAKIGIIQSIEYVSLFMVLFFLIWQITNQDRIERIYLVLAFSFTLPIWDVFNGILQKLAAISTYFLIKLSFIPIRIEGLYLLLPNGSFVVASYCSGLRQQIIALTLITLYAYFNKIEYKKLAVFYVITVVFAFILNLIRIYIIVISGYLTNMKSSLLDDHSVLGWSIFGIGMALYIFAINKYLDSVERRNTII